MTKASLREEALRFRNSIDPFSENTEEFITEFFECLKPQSGQVVALYWPKGKEFDTGPLIEQLLKQGIVCALPVISPLTPPGRGRSAAGAEGEGDKDKILRFANWNENIPLIKGPFDIMQPEVTDKTVWLEPDIVVVPMLAFDRHGHRLGYGGGYYDATLAALRARKTIQAVGIGYSAQAVLFNLPSEPHDQRMDWIITPHKVQRLKL